jgi:hypothetical protein
VFQPLSHARKGAPAYTPHFDATPGAAWQHTFGCAAPALQTGMPEGGDAITDGSIVESSDPFSPIETVRPPKQPKRGAAMAMGKTMDESKIRVRMSGSPCAVAREALGRRGRIVAASMK